VKDPDWTCKIDEGPAGVNAPRWSPDGQNIILVADFQIRLTIWSLVNRSCLHINGPKFADRGLAFSPDGSVMALLEVRSWSLPRLHPAALRRQDGPEKTGFALSTTQHIGGLEGLSSIPMTHFPMHTTGGFQSSL